MRNNTYNSLEDDHSNVQKKSTKSLVFESDQNIEYLKSVKYNSDGKLCIFERDKDGYGFKITGNAPVKVQSVRKDSFAWKSGLRENDVIKEVNGHPVFDKEHREVVALIRKEANVQLLVVSEHFQSISQSASLSPKVSRLPKYEPTLDRPNSLPKGSTKGPPQVKPKPRSLIQKPTPYQPAQNNNVDPHIKNPTELAVLGKYNSPDNISDCSISTSSTESESPKKVPVKKGTSGRISPVISPDGTPTKSNSYNIPHQNTTSVMKMIPLPRKMAPDKLKNKTIPPDGAKSYNTTVGNKDNKFDSQSAYGTLPKKRQSGFILGRDFDEDAKEEDGSDSSLSLIDMLASTKDALSKPGLVAILLNYVKEKFEDMKIMIFYYSCKYYQSLRLRGDFQTDAQRMANEIITTFLCEKSPLYISVNIDAIAETLRNFKAGDNYGTLFDPMLEIIYELLKDIVEDVRGKVKRGIQLSEDVSCFVNSINTSMTQDREINLLHRTMCNIFNKTNKDSEIDDSALATQIGLATMYQFFHRSNFLPGASIRARSTDCINTLNNQSKLQTIGDFFKIGTLCSPYQQKLTLNKRKKAKSVNGHNLVDAACKEPEECAICEGLLWGVSPQGMFCTMCSNYYHVACKKKNKTPCSRKLRKSNSQLNNKEEKSAFFKSLSRKSSTNSIRSVNNSVSGDNLNTNGGTIFNNCILPSDEKSSVMVGENIDISKSQSEDQLNRPLAMMSMFDRFGSNYDLNNPSGNQSVDNGGLYVDQGTVIQELIQDEALNDPDMKMEESFDAETEISSVFQNFDENCDKKTSIVLLEFYHKTRYILMNLKRFWYTLVQKWPPSQSLYFKALSLDCIEPFVNLIKSLVITIEKCIVDKKNFVGLEQAVLDWLSENNDDRLKEWICLSSNLCCTNSLNIIKQMKQTTLRTIPELTNILKAKFHKMVMIEELTQIRPLLISLPLIVKNIIKCLTKLEPAFSDELTVWKQVSIKMDYLCEYIDRCCIPLVDWINNGAITRRSEKIEWQSKSSDSEKEIRELCLDFPRTLFHHPVFDFQIAKIIAWSTNTKRIGLVIPTTYFKKGTDVLLIFYKTFIVVLQKENDHYVLKPIRPLKNLFDKQPPIIEIDDSMYVTNGGQEDNHYVLNIVTNKPDNAFLLRIGFSRLEVVESWMDYIGTRSYSLGRSISIFKNNDLKSMPESHFERTPSNMSNKSKVSSETLELILNPNVNPDNEEKDADKSVDNYMTLAETLAKASELMNSRAPLSGILNVAEDNLSNHIKAINDDGAKSLEDVTAILYHLSHTAIQQTHQTLAKTCPKVSYSAESDLDQFISRLRSTAVILEHWKKRTESPEKIKPPVAVRMRPNKKQDAALQAEQSIPKPHNEACTEPESAEDNTDSTDCRNRVGSIIDDIIGESIAQIRSSQEARESRSYKYVPALSLMPSADPEDYVLSETAYTPSYDHLNSPVDETVTVSRAQIVLKNRKSSTSSSY